MIVERVYMKSTKRALFDRNLRVRPVMSLKKAILRCVQDGNKAVIAEFKRASPSGFVNNANADLERYLQSLGGRGIAGVSILAEPHYFHGSYEDIAIAQKYPYPVLVKDFISSEGMIKSSFNAGGDCLLLIADFLGGQELLRLYNYARGIGMEVLIEFHDPECYQRIPESIDVLIGYNRRNLRTLKIEPDENAALKVMSSDTRLKILESGLKSSQDPGLEGFDGMLVGESMLTERFNGEV